MPEHKQSQSESKTSLSIELITTEQTIPLRHSVLRPGRSLTTAHFEGDSDATTRHFGAFDHDKLIGIASLFRLEMTEMPGISAYKLRGMAIQPRSQRSGIGQALALACIAFAKENGAEILWCNARTCAIGFYRKLGFEILGGEIQIPDVGPHFRMFIRMNTRTA